MTESDDFAAETATENNDGDTSYPPSSQHHTLKYSLLGPSLTKSGQDGVDQTKVSEIIYNASKGSKFFNNEENRDKTLTVKISRILAKKRELERIEAQGGLKQDLKKADDYIAELEYGRDLSQAVVHIDCDAFYAAVEELDRPELKELPFAVGMGVLTTCNYMARKFGCRSGMAGFVADKLCPQLIHIPLNFEKYTAKAKEVRAILEQYDPRFESASIDEAYLNITKYCQDYNMEPEDAVQQMREQVYRDCKITISAGIAANAKLAKICSNKNKPNGQFRLSADRVGVLAFMRDLPTRKVNGIGRVFERELDAIGIKTCGQIYEQRHYLARLFGEKAFQFLMGVYLGLGRTDIRPAEEFERKSVGTESTFHDISDPQELRAKLRWTAEELERDLQRTEFKGRTLVLKIKLHTYEVFTRQIQPPKAVHTADDLYHFSLPMLTKLEKEMPGMKLRLMGLRCTHLLSTKKGDVDFFGRARQQTTLARGTSEDSAAKADLDEDGWQIWPDAEAEFEDAARQEEREEEAEEMARLSQEINAGYNPDGAPSDYRRYGNGFAWRSVLEEEARAEQQRSKENENEQALQQWSCPICSIPQPVDEKAFNEHIDGCLSRQTIKEMVKTANEEPAEKRVLSSMPANTAKRKRGRPSLSDWHKLQCVQIARQRRSFAQRYYELECLAPLSVPSAYCHNFIEQNTKTADGHGQDDLPMKRSTLLNTKGQRSDCFETENKQLRMIIDQDDDAKKQAQQIGLISELCSSLYLTKPPTSMLELSWLSTILRTSWTQEPRSASTPQTTLAKTWDHETKLKNLNLRAEKTLKLKPDRFTAFLRHTAKAVKKPEQVDDVLRRVRSEMSDTSEVAAASAPNEE